MSGPADNFPPMPCDRVLPISDRPTVAELMDLLRYFGPETVVWVAHGEAGVREMTCGSMPRGMSPTRKGGIILRLPGVPAEKALGGWPAPAPLASSTVATSVSPEASWIGRLRRRLVP